MSQPVTTVGRDGEQSERWLNRGIVVGIDGSDASVEALRCALRLGALASTTVRAVAVWQPVPFGKWGTPASLPAEDAAAILTRVVERVCGDRVPDFFTAMPKQGAPAEALIASAAGADLLIVGTRGRSKIAGLILGSVSAACVGGARCPVLVVNGPE
jgi:nucleotide-binding universal stress UspA family protein